MNQNLAEGNVTLCLLKPIITNRIKEEGFLAKIDAEILGYGFEILFISKIKWTEEITSEFYKDHVDKPSYKNIQNAMNDKHVCVVILKCKDPESNCINRWREIIGPHPPKIGTLRYKYGSEKDNGFHGSDSRLEFEREFEIISRYLKN